MKIETGLLTVLVALMGVLFGTLISPYLNHRLNLRTSRRDLFFKRKLEYFEKIAENIDFNIRIYKNSISKLEEERNIKILKQELKKIKEERKNFRISSSPLYFDTHEIARRIKEFAELEKRIFLDLEKLIELKEIKKEIILDLERKLEELKITGTWIILEIKRELAKEKL